MTADDPEEALYAEPPEQFVAGRDALARALRAAGDRAGAARVRGLRRPTRAAWAINAAVRARPEAARSLTDAATGLRDAQRDLLAGGDAAGLRAAQARVAAASAALLEALPVSDPATIEKVRQTLRAAAVDEDTLEQVISGRLLREQVASGFGELAGFAPPPPPAATSRAAKDGLAASGAAREAERAAQAAAERAAQEAAERAAREAAEREAAARRRRIDQARERESTAEADAVHARRALEEAEATVKLRRAERDAAEERLAEAALARERAQES